MVAVGRREELMSRLIALLIIAISLMSVEVAYSQEEEFPPLFVEMWLPIVRN
jgi:hypothetical protein